MVSVRSCPIAVVDVSKLTSLSGYEFDTEDIDGYVVFVTPYDKGSNWSSQDGVQAVCSDTYPGYKENIKVNE